MNWTIYWLLAVTTYAYMVGELLYKWDEVTKEFPYLTPTQIVVVSLVSQTVMAVFWPVSVSLIIFSRSCKLLAKGLRKLSSTLKQREMKASNGEQEL